MGYLVKFEKCQTVYQKAVTVYTVYILQISLVQSLLNGQRWLSQTDLCLCNGPQRMCTVTLVTIILSKIMIAHTVSSEISWFVSKYLWFVIVDAHSMQDACHNELSECDVACHESPSSSVFRASDCCTMEGHGFDSCQGLSCFFCPSLMT